MVSTFGVVYDVHRQCFDWSQFRAFARLDKKTDESLEKYYYSFVAMCKRVCRMQVKPAAETGKFLSFLNWRKKDQKKHAKYIRTDISLDIYS